MAAVTLKGVSKMFGTNAVVHDVNLEIPDKEFVVMAGPSGCGKTTTLRMIAAYDGLRNGVGRCDRTQRQQQERYFMATATECHGCLGAGRALGGGLVFIGGGSKQSVPSERVTPS